VAFKAIPEVYGDGWVILGDAGQFVNSVHREGSNIAMTTGALAGETIAHLHRKRQNCSKAKLTFRIIFIRTISAAGCLPATARPGRTELVPRRLARTNKQKRTRF
jgi:hypothetical protein